MKYNLKTLMAIAGIIILATIAAHYGGLFAVTSEPTCDDDYLFVGQTLSVESPCTYIEVTVEEFGLNNVLISLDRGGWIQSSIYESGEKDEFTIDGCNELWTVECNAIFANSASFEICYEYPPSHPEITLTTDKTTVTSGEIIHITGVWDFDGMSDREVVACYESIPKWYNIFQSRNPPEDTGTFEIYWTAPEVAETESGYFYAVMTNTDNEKVASDSRSVWVTPTIPDVPCTGLSPCNRGESIFEECCAGNIWQCAWSNYDGEGYRMQWELWEECDADCTCDGATTGQECWCSDITPDCAGLSMCDRDAFLCDECCDGDVWECGGHYKWRLLDSCTADETCECTGGECMDCDCVATATPTPANIDDSSDTLTFDKSSYRLGDTVYMCAVGTNIGEVIWTGKVTFTVTQPNGVVYEIIEQKDTSVRARSSETAYGNFQLPATGESGTWTAQSKWIDDDGNLHAQSSILDLGGDGSEDDSMWIIGGIVAFLILIYFAYRKKQSKR